MELGNLKQALNILIGSGAAIALASGVYVWLLKGRIKIPKDFDNAHTDPKSSRHRIRVINKGFKTLVGLVCYISIVDIMPSDIENEKSDFADYFLISSENYVPVCKELIIWDTGQPTFDLHPKQCVDVDLLHYDRINKAIIVPSEQGYTKLDDRGKPRTRARVRITTLREYTIKVKLCAVDYHSKEYAFKIRPNQDEKDVTVVKM